MERSGERQPNNPENNVVSVMEVSPKEETENNEDLDVASDDPGGHERTSGSSTP